MDRYRVVLLSSILRERLLPKAIKIKRLPQDDTTNWWSAILPDRTAHAPNVWSAVCQNAVGVTKGTFGGVLVAGPGVRARFEWELFTNRHEA